MRALTWRGWTDSRIARQYGVETEQVSAFRRRHGIPSGVKGGRQPGCTWGRSLPEPEPQALETYVDENGLTVTR